MFAVCWNVGMLTSVLALMGGRWAGVGNGVKRRLLRSAWKGTPHGWIWDCLLGRTGIWMESHLLKPGRRIWPLLLHAGEGLVETKRTRARSVTHSSTALASTVAHQHTNIAAQQRHMITQHMDTTTLQLRNIISTHSTPCGFDTRLTQPPLVTTTIICSPFSLLHDQQWDGYDAAPRLQIPLHLFNDHWKKGLCTRRDYDHALYTRG